MALRALAALALALRLAFGVATRNTDVVRVIDAAGPVVRVRADITFVEAQGVYEYLVPAPACDLLAYVFAKQQKGAALEVTRGARDVAGQHFSIAVPGASGAIRVRTVFTRVLEPLPASIGQADAQYVVLQDSHYFVSPYATDSQRLTVKLGTPVRNVESFSEREPFQLKAEALAFGPYENVPAGEASSLRVHYRNHAPFATFTDVLREIEVSHWGNIAVEEHFDLEHTGATLKGGFSRFEYMRQRYGADTPSFRSLSAKLPPDAWGIYYRDRIGNISTTRLAVYDKFIDMEVEPRYPMFGGWKVNFYQGYNVPTEGALSIIDGDRYRLTMNFGVPYEIISCDELQVKVILPEGATDLEVHVPFAVEQTRDRRFTWVDTQFMGGRPVIILKKANVVKDHNVPFTVTYRMSSTAMVVDVGILVGAYLGIYLFVMLALRINLRLGEPEAPGSSKAKKA